MTQQARDVDLNAWLNGFGFHPANTKVKQLGHELARKAVASLATLLHWLVPPGREKSLVFTHLELVLMYANKGLAVGGGTAALGDDEAYTEQVLTSALVTYADVRLPEDARIREYKQEQLQERPTLPGAADDAPRTGFTGAAVQEAAEPAIHAEEDSAPHETFRAEELSDEPRDVDVVVVGGKGYVQIASLARSLERKREALPPDMRAFAEDTPDGFYGTLSTPVAVNQVISALAAAADRAFTAVR